MKPSIYRISLDVHDAHSSVCLDMKRQDTARQIDIALTDGGFPYQISEECYAVFAATKADGKKLLHHCEIRNNIIQYIVRPQTTAAIGLMECEIKLYGANDKLLFSPGFNILVSENAVTDDDDLISEDDVDELTHLISEAAKVIAEGKEVNAESRELIDDMEAKRATLDQQIAATKEYSESANRASANANLASDRAEGAANLAVSNARKAETSASNAKESEDNAKASAQTAVNMANAALQSQRAAEAAAERAEAAAEQAGNGSDSGQNPTVATVEPAEDDIPNVHFTVKGGMPFTKTEGEVQVLMRYISKTATIERHCTAKVQGGSSGSDPSYKKRNWTIKVYKDSAYEKKEKLSFKGWPAMNKFVLKAGWVIPGHLRNVGAAKIWGQIMRSRSDYANLPEELRNSPNQGATDGFHVRVFINGVYWGIYDWIVAKDQLFGQDKDNAAHSILNSELNNQPTCAFATTTPTINGNWSEELLDSMTAGTKTSMENWIKFVAGSTDADFVANAENYFDVQSVIDAICFDRIIMTVDNMCRNQIVFKYDTKWYMGKWDLDAILGLPPVAGQTWYPYDTAYQEGYVAYKDYGIINMLYDRTEKLFLERFKENYWRLRSGPLSEANLVEVFGRLSDRLRSIEGLLAEENASTTGNGQFTGMPNVGKDTIQQIREIVVKRCAFMDEEVENMSGESGGGETPDVPDTPETVPCTGISLDKSTLTFNGDGTQTITATVTPADTTDNVVWVSSNPDVASITVEGNVCTVQSVSNGDAVITVTCGNYRASCNVAVSGFVTVLYELASPTAFDGATRIDTGVAPYTEDADSTLAIDFVLATGNGQAAHVYRCDEYRIADYAAKWMVFVGPENTNATYSLYGTEAGTGARIVVTRNANTKTWNVYGVDLNGNKFTDQTNSIGDGWSKTMDFLATEDNLLLGATVDGYYFKGTINRFVLDKRVWSAEEINAFLNPAS